MKNGKKTFINFTAKEIKKLKNLIVELDEYYEKIDGSEEEKIWDFEDVDNQRQIAVEMSNILRWRLNNA